MADVASRRPFPSRSLAAGLALLAAAGLLSAFNLHAAFPHIDWLVVANRHDDLTAVVAFYSALPRIAVALLAGLGLGLSGTMFQQVLRNPLAEPSTLGVSAGAYLALAVAAVLWPGLPIAEKIVIAMIGAAGSIALVMGVAWRQAFSMLALSLAGLTLNLVFGSLASILVTFHRDGVVSLSFWGSGALRQNDWLAARTLALGLAPAALALFPAARSLSLFDLGDDAMRGVGVSVVTLRLILLGLATWMAGVIVACAGMIGFIGLVAPWLAGLFGARRIGERFVAAAVIGAALLLATDQALVAFGPAAQSVPTGAVTALLGAPILLFILRRPVADRQTGDTRQIIRARPGAAWPIGIAALVLAASIAMAATVGADQHGWHILGGEALAEVLPWRWPRIAAAAGSGAALAIAGTVLQRLTANPMASPELLGISAGAILGALAAMLVVPAGGPFVQISGGAVGSMAVLAAIVLIARRSNFSANHVLLVGIGLGTALSAVANVLTILPDPRLESVQIWMVGSTDLISPSSALAVGIAAVAGFLAACLANRWLTILPLGGGSAIALGMRIGIARLMLLTLVSILSAVSTLIVGPLSFVGLMAPHMGRMLGARRAVDHLLLSAILGGCIMVLADWAGRSLVFPYEIPAGLLASVLGGLYFLLSMRRC